MDSRLRHTSPALLALGFLALACTEPAPPPVKLAFVVQPVTSTRDEPISPAVAVEAQDAAGNRVTSWNGTVGLAIDTAITNLAGTRVAPAVEGVATFPDLRVMIVGTGLRLNAFSTGLSSATSLPFDVEPGPVARLVFTSIPGSVRSGMPLSPAVLVELQDAGGFTVTSATDPVTLSLGANPTGASLSGVLTEAAVNGIATFASLSIDRPGNGYALRASARGLVATSSAFNVRQQFASVTAGYFHSCGLTPSGAVYCWGDIGDTPSLVATSQIFTSISSGRDERCALTGTGAAYCWSGNSAPSILSGDLTFSSIAAGYAHTCAVTSAGAGYCWGENSSGELGNGTVGGSNASPQLVSGGLTFAQISTGRLFSCGATTDNVTYCWGNNGSRMLGTESDAGSAVPAAVSGGLDFSAVSAGGFHACALTPAGAAYCWGQNSNGQLGDGTFTQRPTPVAVSGGLTFAALSAGNRHTCGLDAAGVAYCWGDNTDGMLGSGDGPSRNAPAAVSGGLIFASIRAGRFHTCGIATDGETYCWGNNNYGLLGNGTGVASAIPVRVP